MCDTVKPLDTKDVIPSRLTKVWSSVSLLDRHPFFLCQREAVAWKRPNNNRTAERSVVSPRSSSVSFLLFDQGVPLHKWRNRCVAKEYLLALIFGVD